MKRYDVNVGDLIKTINSETNCTNILVDGGENSTLRFRLAKISCKEVGIILSLDSHKLLKEFIKGENYFLVQFGERTGYLSDDEFVIIQKCKLE